MPFVRRQGVRVHYELEGSGPTMILHTGGAGDLEMWRLAGYVDLLRAHYQLVLLDHRGHGKSDRPRDRSAHRIEAYREDVHAVLEAAGASRAAFVGYSDGSKVGVALAHGYPEQVSAIIDLDGLVPRDLNEPEPRRARLELAATVRRLGTEAVLRQIARDERYPGPESILANLGATDSEMFALELEEWAHWTGPASLLRALRVPILRLTPGQGGSDGMRHILRSVPGSRWCSIDASGHLDVFARADRVVPLILEFVRPS